MQAGKPRVKVPKAAVAKGEVFEVKALISHPMESGQRKDKEGNLIPRRIINKFVFSYNDEPRVTADFAPAISSNPFLQFYTTATESGELKFEWFDDDGTVYTETKPIEVA